MIPVDMLYRVIVFLFISSVLFASMFVFALLAWRSAYRGWHEAIFLLQEMLEMNEKLRSSGAILVQIMRRHREEFSTGRDERFNREGD